jgi:hypothetical protein
MKKASTKTTDLDIPVLKREQLGNGIRGKYHKRFVHDSNVVVLEPDIQKAFPTSEAVNKALAHMLIFAKETQELTSKSKSSVRKRLEV